MAEDEHDEGGYGAVLAPLWWRDIVVERHPGDGSPVYCSSPAATTATAATAGAPFVLLHGVGNDGGVFSSIISALAEHGPVVAPTMSPHLLTDVGPDRLDVSVNLVEWLSELVPPPWRLVGHSMGGVMTGLILRTRPELVSGAVLLNSPLPSVVDRIRHGDTFDRAGRALLFMRLLARVTALGRPRLPRRLRLAELAVVRQGLRGFVHDPGALDNRVLSRSIVASRTADGIDFLELARHLPVWEAEPFTGVPVHIVLGEADPLIPDEDLEAVREAYPEASIEILGDCGHFAHLEWPRATLDAITGHLPAPVTG